MKKLFLLIPVFCLLIFASHAQVGMTFPELEGETVHDEKVMLPSDTDDKFTLVGMAYSKRSEDDLITWFQPVYQKFIQESEGLFSSFGYDVNVFFVPMFTGVKAAGMGAAKKKALKKIDAKLHPHILFYKGNLKQYKDALDFEKRDVPYFFVINKEGEIVYATSGAFTDNKMTEIEETLE